MSNLNPEVTVGCESNSDHPNISDEQQDTAIESPNQIESRYSHLGILNEFASPELEEQHQRTLQIHKDSIQNILKSQQCIVSFNQDTKPHLDRVLYNLQNHTSRIRALNARLSRVHTAIRRMRQSLVENGVSFPDEEDPVEAIERRANEELERRKTELYERRQREKRQQSQQYSNIEEVSTATGLSMLDEMNNKTNNKTSDEENDQTNSVRKGDERNGNKNTDVDIFDIWDLNTNTNRGVSNNNNNDNSSIVNAIGELMTANMTLQDDATISPIPNAHTDESILFSTETFLE